MGDTYEVTVSGRVVLEATDKVEALCLKHLLVQRGISAEVLLVKHDMDFYGVTNWTISKEV